MKSKALSGKNIMLRNKIKLSLSRATGLIFLTMTSAGFAAENIIQQEKISFEKCLNVITTSQDKLSIAPEITDTSKKKRVAVFTLIDGTLKITCDGIEGNVTVSINTD